MFSVIVCSVDPAAAEALRENVAQTIGVPFEWLACDNRRAPRGICAVYNALARQARYDCLCFVHEDVRFRTEEWGRLLAAELAQPRCGVIGFAGGVVKTRGITGWCLDGDDARTHYAQPDAGDRMRRYDRNPAGEAFSRVVCLDGFCLAAPRAVWAAAPFDEALLGGFHGYDLDFTLAAARRFDNRVCHTVEVEHRSAGCYTRAWREALEAVHAKWRDELPRFVGPALSQRTVRACERRAEALWWRKLMRLGLCGRRESLDAALRFVVRHPLRAEAWTLLYKWVRYRIVRTKPQSNG